MFVETEGFGWKEEKENSDKHLRPPSPQWNFPSACPPGPFLTTPRRGGDPGAGKGLLAGSQPLAGLDPPGGWGGVRLKKGPGVHPRPVEVCS